MIFAVFQEGVYRHKCGGLFDNADAAKAAADNFAATDIDTYHEWTVVPFDLNEPTSKNERGSDLIEREPIYTTRKKGASS